MATTYSLKFDISEARKNLEDLKSLNTEAYQKSRDSLKKLNTEMEIYDKQISDQQAAQKKLAAQIKALDGARGKDGKSTAEQRAALKKLNAEYSAGQKSIRKLINARKLNSQSIKQTTKDLDTYMKSNRDLVRFIKQEETQTRQLEKAQQKQQSTAKKGEAVRNSQFNAFVRHIRQLETMVVLYYSLTRAYQSTIGIGMELNKVVEQNSYGLAALISSNTELIRNGKVANDDQAKFAAALRMSQETMLDLKDAALETVATFPELTQIFQQAIGFALQMGDAMGSSTEQINDRTIEIAQAMSNMGGAIGMSSDRILEEIRSIFSGDVTADSKLGIILFGNPSQANQAIKESKKQVNGFYDLMSKELQEFQKLGGVDAYFINIQKLKGEYEGLWKDISEPIFRDVNRTIVQLTKDIRDNKEEFKAWGKEIYAGAKTVAPILDDILAGYMAIRFAPALLKGIATATKGMAAASSLASLQMAAFSSSADVLDKKLELVVRRKRALVTATKALRAVGPAAILWGAYEAAVNFDSILESIGLKQKMFGQAGGIEEAAEEYRDAAKKLAEAQREYDEALKEGELTSSIARERSSRSQEMLFAQERYEELSGYDPESLKSIKFSENLNKKVLEIFKDTNLTMERKEQLLLSTNDLYEETLDILELRAKKEKESTMSLEDYLRYYEAIGEKQTVWAIKEVQLRDELGKKYESNKEMLEAIIQAKRKEFFATEDTSGAVRKLRKEYEDMIDAVTDAAAARVFPKQYQFTQEENTQFANIIKHQFESGREITPEDFDFMIQNASDEGGEIIKGKMVNAGDIIGNSVASTLSDAITASIKEGSFDLKKALESGLSSVGSGLISGGTGAMAAGMASTMGPWGAIGVGAGALVAGEALGGSSEPKLSLDELAEQKYNELIDAIKNNTEAQLADARGQVGQEKLREISKLSSEAEERKELYKALGLENNASTKEIQQRILGTLISGGSEAKKASKLLVEKGYIDTSKGMIAESIDASTELAGLDKLEMKLTEKRNELIDATAGFATSQDKAVVAQEALTEAMKNYPPLVSAGIDTTGELVSNLQLLGKEQARNNILIEQGVITEKEANDLLIKNTGLTQKQIDALTILGLSSQDAISALEETSDGLLTLSESLSVYNSSISEQVSLFESAASSFQNIKTAAQQEIDTTEAMMRSPVEATEYLRGRYEEERAQARAAESTFLDSSGNFREGITPEEVAEYNREVGEFISIAARYREQVGATYASSRPDLLEDVVTDLEQTRNMALRAEDYYRVQLEESKITNTLLRELQKSIDRGNELTEDQVAALESIESYNEAIAQDATRSNEEIISQLQAAEG